MYKGLRRRSIILKSELINEFREYYTEVLGVEAGVALTVYHTNGDLWITGPMSDEFLILAALKFAIINFDQFGTSIELS